MSNAVEREVDRYLEIEEERLPRNDELISLLEVFLEVLGHAFQNLRNRLPAIDPYQLLSSIRSRLLGDHRSFVRLFGSHLTFYRPECRFELQYNRVQMSEDDEEENNMTPALSLADLLWLEGGGETTLIEPGIAQRCQYFGPPISPKGIEPPRYLLYQNTLPGFPRITLFPESQGHSEFSPRASTPVGGRSMRSRLFHPTANGSTLLGETTGFDPNAGDKIEKLEKELEALKRQMAMIIMTREADEMKGKRERNESTGSSDSGIASYPPIVPKVKLDLEEESKSGASIPPPPPPPPADFWAIKPKEPVAKKRDHLKEPPKKVNSLTDVLKDLGKVKLRPTSVQRSPGGTPCGNGRRNSNPEDVGAFLVAALKRKFQNTQQASSPQTPTAGNCSADWEDSPETTPTRPHRNRRSSLFRPQV